MTIVTDLAPALAETATRAIKARTGYAIITPDSEIEHSSALARAISIKIRKTRKP